MNTLFFYAVLLSMSFSRGLKTQKKEQWSKAIFEAFPYLEMNRSTWEKAANLSLSLRNKGITIPPSDLILSSLALENKCMVFTKDSHFDMIPGISLYSPEPSKIKNQS